MAAANTMDKSIICDNFLQLLGNDNGDNSDLTQLSQDTVQTHTFSNVDTQPPGTEIALDYGLNSTVADSSLMNMSLSQSQSLISGQTEDHSSKRKERRSEW